jgi:hypothetical protein
MAIPGRIVSRLYTGNEMIGGKILIIHGHPYTNRTLVTGNNQHTIVKALIVYLNGYTSCISVGQIVEEGLKCNR